MSSEPVGFVLRLIKSWYQWVNGGLSVLNLELPIDILSLVDNPIDLTSTALLKL